MNLKGAPKFSIKFAKIWKKHKDTYNVKIDAISAVVDQRNQEFDAKPKDVKCIQSRHIVAVMGFLVFVVLNAQRANLSIAMVAMVNSTSAEHKGNFSYSNFTECPAETSSETDTVQSQGEFDWDPVLQGYILGSGSVGYILTHIPGGRMADTFGAKNIIMISILLASVCNLVTPLAAWWNVYVLIAVHFIKGLAQGVIQPAASVLMGRWFPQCERSYLSSVILCGIPTGNVVGSLVSGLLCDTAFWGGWPSVFYTMGGLGILVFILIFFFLHGDPKDDPRISQAELEYITEDLTQRLSTDAYKVPWRGIFTSVSSYALFIGFFGQSYMFFHFLTVHPIYMGTVLHYSMTKNGLLSSLPNILQCLAALCASRLSDWLNRRELASVGAVRKACSVAGTICFCTCVGGIYMAGCDGNLHDVFLTLAVILIGIAIPSALILSVDMTPKFSGTLMGISCSIGNSSGFIVPVVTGMIIADEHSIARWRQVFLVAIAVQLFTGLFFLLFGSARVQPWDLMAEEVGSQTKGKSNSSAEEGRSQIKRKSSSTAPQVRGSQGDRCTIADGCRNLSYFDTENIL